MKLELERSCWRCCDRVSWVVLAASGFRALDQLLARRAPAPAELYSGLKRRDPPAGEARFGGRG